MASPLTREVVQDPNAGAALQPPQPVSLAPVSLGGGQRPASQSSEAVNAALGKLGDMLADKIKDNTQKSLLDGQAQYLSGVSEEQMRKNGDYYTEQGYQGLKIVNDTDAWYQSKVQDLDNKASLTPDQYNAELSKERGAYLDGIKDPTLKQAAVDRLAELSPRLTQMQIQKSSDYQKQQYSSTFGQTLKSVAQNGMDTPRTVPGSPLAVSPNQVSQPLPSLTPADRDAAIRTVLGEAGGEGDMGMAAVAQVIKNRTLDGGYGKGVYGVVHAPKQFSVWNSDGGGLGGEGVRGYATTSTAYQKAGAIVDAVFSGHIADMTNGATHYYAPQGMEGGRAPNWYEGLVAQSGNQTDIGNHRFTGKANSINIENYNFKHGGESHAVTDDGSPDFKMDGLNVIQRFTNTEYGRTASAGAQPFKNIVMHVTGKPDVESEMQYMSTPDANRGNAYYGYTFLIDKDGSVIQTAPLDKRTNQIMGNKERGIYNNNSVGIALVGGDKGASPQQIEAGTKLVHGLQQRYGIGDQNAVAHGEIQADRSHGLGPVGEGSEAADFMTALRSGNSGIQTGRPAPTNANTQTIRMFNSNGSSVKWDAAKDQMVSDLAQGDSTLLNALGGISNLPSLRFTPDQVKAVYDASQRADKARNNQWNLGRVKQAEQIVADVEAGADRDTALNQIDQWVKQGYYDDESGKALAARIIAADQKHQNEVDAQEINTPKAQQTQLDLREKMRKSVEEGDASYTPKVAWQELAQSGLSEKVQGQIRASLASSYEGFMQTRRSNQPYDPNQAMTNDQLQRAASYGNLTAEQATDIVSKMNISNSAKQQLSNNLLAAIRGRDEKKAQNPDFDPVKAGKVDDIKRLVTSGAIGRDEAIARLGKIGLGDNEIKSASSEIYAMARAYDEKNRPDPLLNPKLIEQYSPIYNVMMQNNTDADPTNDVHYGDPRLQAVLKNLAKQYNLNQDQMDKLKQKFADADKATADEYRRKVEQAGVIAAENKRTSQAVDQAIANGNIGGLDKFSWSGKDPFTGQDNGTTTGTQLAINTLKAKANEAAQTAVEQQSAVDPSKRDIFAAQAKLTAFQTVHRVLARSGVVDPDTQKEFMGFRSDFVGKDGNIRPEVRSAFDDYRQMINDPQMGKAYADKYVPDDLRLLLNDAYNATTGYSNSDDALRIAYQRRQDAAMAKYNDAQTVEYLKAARPAIDEAVNNQYGATYFNALLGSGDPGNTIDDAPFATSPANMSMFHSYVETMATSLHLANPTYGAKDIATLATETAMKNLEMVHGNLLFGDLNSDKSVSQLVGLERGQLGPALDRFLWLNQDKFGQWQGGDKDTEGMWHRGLTARAAGESDPLAFGKTVGNKINGYTPAYSVTYLKDSKQFRVDIFLDPERTKTTGAPITIDAATVANDYNNYISHPSWYQKAGQFTVRNLGKAWNTMWDNTKDEGTNFGFGTE